MNDKISRIDESLIQFKDGLIKWWVLSALNSRFVRRSGVLWILSHAGNAITMLYKPSGVALDSYRAAAANCLGNSPPWFFGTFASRQKCKRKVSCRNTVFHQNYH